MKIVIYQYKSGLLKKELGRENIPEIITKGIEEDIENTRLMLAEMHNVPEEKVKAIIK